MWGESGKQPGSFTPPPPHLNFSFEKLGSFPFSLLIFFFKNLLYKILFKIAFGVLNDKNKYESTNKYLGATKIFYMLITV